MIPRGFLAALLALVLAVWQASPVCPEDLPQFQLGFQILADLIPVVVGEPLENEHHNPINGDGLQVTTGGLMVWRKADNWTAFTNGWRTWVNGPLGLQERGNEERFAWETEAETASGEPADAAGPPILDLLSPTSPLGEAGSTPTELPPASPTSQVWATGLPTPPTSTAEPTATPTPEVQETATQLPTATATIVPPTATAVPSVGATATLPAGGILSSSPAGDWVTSTHPSTRYYTSRGNVSRWQDWAADNRIWFGSEAALLSAYPGRIREDAPSTPTPRPAATATRTPAAAATSTATVAPAATATRTATPPAPPTTGGIQSPDPAGDWVTSTYASTKYYTTRDKTSVWKDWAEGNRIWFPTEAALLAAYPGRVRK